ncbi:MAG: ester cyclase [Chloroflexi bacterium]|nr:ester cyclase [Chloroflexota bacterium]
MSLEENRNVTRRLCERVWNQGDMTAIDELLAENFVDHVDFDRPWDREQYKQAWTQVRVIFPDLHGTIENLIAERDMVAGWITFRGTHKGELWGIPPTGRQVVYRQFVHQRIVDGKIVDNWGLADFASVRRQLEAKSAG